MSPSRSIPRLAFPAGPIHRVAFAVALLFSALPAVPAAGQAQASGEVRGRVVEAPGERPVADAEVRLTRLGRVARTDSLGRFSLAGLPPGRHPLEVRRLGYAPLQAEVSVAEEALEIEIQLAMEPQPIAGVTAEARPVSARMEAFENRRARGGSGGRYLGPEELAREARRQLPDVLRRFPGVRIASNGSRVYLASSRTQPPRALMTTPRPCYAQIYVNGVQIYGDDGSDPPNLLEFDIPHLEGLEYYNSPSSTPPEFRTLFSSCGTLVLWMRDSR